MMAQAPSHCGSRPRSITVRRTALTWQCRTRLPTRPSNSRSTTASLRRHFRTLPPVSSSKLDRWPWWAAFRNRKPEAWARFCSRNRCQWWPAATEADPGLGRSQPARELRRRSRPIVPFLAMLPGPDWKNRRSPRSPRQARTILSLPQCQDCHIRDAEPSPERAACTLSLFSIFWTASAF